MSIRIVKSLPYSNMGVSAVIIALNEEKKIGRAIDSIQWADEIVVVDSGSSDRTIEICKEKGVCLTERTFDNFASQKNYAISLAKQEWVLSIDADEVVTPQLAKEIRSAIALPENIIAGYRFRRRNYFLGKLLRFARLGHESVLRLFRKDCGRFVGVVHEEAQVDGPVITLKHILEHYGTEALSDYFRKLKLYTDFEVERMSSEGRIPSYGKSVFYPPTKWLIDYVFCGGFLDGWHGFVYHALSCYYGWTKNLKAQLKRNKNNKLLTLV